MPSYSSNPLEHLAIPEDQIDKRVDLGEADSDHALQEVDRVIETAPQGQCIAFYFAPPRGDGTPPLFQPLGKFLLQARRDGRLARCLPMPEGSGYVVVMPG